MAIEPVTKVLVAVHDSDRDRFFRSLQRLGVLHVVADESATKAGPASQPGLARLVSAIEFLQTRADKEAKARPVLTREEFERRSAGDEYQAALDRLERANRELIESDGRLRSIEAERQRLAPWTPIEHDVRDVYRLRGGQAAFVRFADRAEFDRGKEVLAGLPAELELVSVSDSQAYALLARAGELPDNLLAGIRHEVVDLHSVAGRPRDLVAGLVRERDELVRRQSKLHEELDSAAAELPRLKTAADALERRQSLLATESSVSRTASVRLIHGWVRRRDVKKLERLVADSGLAALAEVEPAPGEEPPVALVNRPVFRPFELVVELFSMPSPNELDPTWLIAPFFGMFFGLCLTDAGYGVVVVALALFLLKRMGWDNKLLGIILVGAILTIPAGALVGGWFGDVPDRLGVPWLLKFKNTLMWFDPMKDPMRFFILSVALGYLQMIAGIAFEIADNLRVRNWDDGLLVQLPWFVFLNGLTARVVFAKQLGVWGGAAMIGAVLASVAAIVVFTQRSKETMLAQWLWFGLLSSVFMVLGVKFGWLPREIGPVKWVAVGLHAVVLGLAGFSIVRARKFKPVPLILGALALAGFGAYLVGHLSWFVAGLLGLVFFAVSPAGSGVLAKLLWGGYALYGATGYIGVVLSYIRLMALGMCTGGVAVAINVIAWMVLKIPVAGIGLALVVLVVGHSYNIAVNVLGAFVHSLRLQYVEFFPRFYAGGGTRFEPFKEKFNYISLKS